MQRRGRGHPSSRCTVDSCYLQEITQASEDYRSWEGTEAEGILDYFYEKVKKKIQKGGGQQPRGSCGAGKSQYKTRVRESSPKIKKQSRTQKQVCVTV